VAVGVEGRAACVWVNISVAVGSRGGLVVDGVTVKVGGGLIVLVEVGI
jgi:hypothetical protein